MAQATALLAPRLLGPWLPRLAQRRRLSRCTITPATYGGGTHTADSIATAGTTNWKDVIGTAVADGYGSSLHGEIVRALSLS
jgi:hypothetical protein